MNCTCKNDPCECPTDQRGPFTRPSEFVVYSDKPHSLKATPYSGRVPKGFLENMKTEVVHDKKY